MNKTKYINKTTLKCRRCGLTMHTTDAAERHMKKCGGTIDGTLTRTPVCRYRKYTLRTPHIDVLMDDSKETTAKGVQIYWSINCGYYCSIKDPTTGRHIKVDPDVLRALFQPADGSHS